MTSPSHSGTHVLLTDRILLISNIIIE